MHRDFILVSAERSNLKAVVNTANLSGKMNYVCMQMFEDAAQNWNQLWCGDFNGWGTHVQL